jgi:glucose-6-phosphate 1-dehydrogenase
MATERLSALVIFGATGDLAKLETVPALVGLVDRDVLDVPSIGAVNPSLTAIANALRVGDHLLDRLG